jgi:hypothetical protein
MPKRQHRAPQGASSMPPKPGQFRSNIILRHTQRFTNTGATTFAVTGKTLAASFGAMCTVTNTTCACLYDAVRVKRIKIWGPSSTAANTVSVVWSSPAPTSNAANVEVSDTSTSSAFPPYVSTAPPRESLASFWTNSGSSSVLATLAVPNAGAIIDVEAELIISDSAATQITSSVVTGVQGEVYYLALDGTSTHSVIPVSSNTTF